MAKKNLFPLIAVVLCSMFGISWKLFSGETHPLKAKVDAFLNSKENEPDAKLVAELRAGNYETVNWLYKTYWNNDLSYSNYKSNKKFLKLYDKVSGQKDAIASKLFWHTNLNEALAEAKKQNKPVLCLEMLGDFTEDFSCANSRFFRTLLYSDETVSQILREKYVLCWESVIQVPKVIIEYPDGKKQIQTITGNSMQLVLNSNGEIMDALPGLYGATYYQKWLKQLCDENYVKNLRVNQKTRITELKNTTLNDNLNNEDWNRLVVENASKGSTPPVAAVKASEISAAKFAVEAPVYKAVYNMQPTKSNGNKKYIKPATPINTETFSTYEKSGFTWEKPSSSTEALIASKKKYNEEELKNTLYNISDNLSKENVRNDVRLHAPILEWLQLGLGNNKKYFVEKVYRELFLTPLNDPKMGLYDKSIYSGTTDDGFLEE
ncbi:MAG: hypothetical protein K0S32_3075 [Bacteroidetes bacterium]|jgi:hypothetical protein|nr:hypothetical protein [Bacteroidota bacterium]